MQNEQMQYRYSGKTEIQCANESEQYVCTCGLQRAMTDATKTMRVNAMRAREKRAKQSRSD